jgi:hypothetical protein
VEVITKLANNDWLDTESIAKKMMGSSFVKLKDMEGSRQVAGEHTITSQVLITETLPN